MSGRVNVQVEASDTVAKAYILDGAATWIFVTVTINLYVVVFVIVETTRDFYFLLPLSVCYTCSVVLFPAT